ncbi:MAG: hypothetical protein HY242_17155 [Afipia sp.]|nr:hypothetical protein [Afipia sp.]
MALSSLLSYCAGPITISASGGENIAALSLPASGSLQSAACAPPFRIKNKIAALAKSNLVSNFIAADPPFYR